jgi:hypothetical protein
MKTVSGGKGPCASMPSARAAAMAGAMTRCSSSPNSPPSPACGFSPATAMRGDPPAQAGTAAWVMRSVCSTASKVTASMARRSDRWMVTSTTRSSSLASIMRTGGKGWPGSAASDCSISVWPGKSTPAAASASLWIGAVTMPAASPRRTHRTASRMQAAAAAPQRIDRPPGQAASPAGRPGGTSTGRQPGGTRSMSAGRRSRPSAPTPGPGRAPHAAARLGRPARRSPTAGPAGAPHTISGPMPAASPIVTSKGPAFMRDCRSR